MKYSIRRWWLLVGVLSCLAVVAPMAGAQARYQADDPVARGKYLATIAGCLECHTPFGPNNQIDVSRAFAGGQLFDLGPLGKVYSKNLTPDAETGIGSWTDDEIKIAIRTGVERDGTHIFPVMPYLTFNNMADADIDAIVAYLRTVPAIRNQVPDRQLNVPTDGLPTPPYRTGITAPDPSDTAARGQYLMTAITACTDCHTPVDEKSGQPIMEKYLAGGQPYEGPWGTIYGGNITPDKDTGIGNWSDEDIARVLHQGVLPESQQWRRVILMPWDAYSPLTDQDTAAIVHFLRNDVKPVSNLVSAAKLNDGFAQYAPPQTTSNPTILLVAGGSVVVVVLALVVLAAVRRRRPTSSSS